MFMKKINDWTQGLFIVVIVLAVIGGMYLHVTRNRPHVEKHICIDKTHATCDGECVCDGMECEK